MLKPEQPRVEPGALYTERHGGRVVRITYDPGPTSIHARISYVRHNTPSGWDTPQHTREQRCLRSDFFRRFAPTPDA